MKNNNSTLFNAWWTVHRKKPAHFVRRKSGLPALVSSKFLLVTSWPLRKQWPVWVLSRCVLTPVNPRSNCTREGCMTSNPAIQSCLTTLSWLLGTECTKARTTGWSRTGKYSKYLPIDYIIYQSWWKRPLIGQFTSSWILFGGFHLIC